MDTETTANGKDNSQPPPTNHSTAPVGDDADDGSCCCKPTLLTAPCDCPPQDYFYDGEHAPIKRNTLLAMTGCLPCKRATWTLR